MYKFIFKNKFFCLLQVLSFFILLSCSTTVNSNTSVSTERLPLSPYVETGVLENGLRWYVMPNKKPEYRASLRLVVNAGSVLEEDDQRGLAHFCEHMAFNGTENFKKAELVQYLESVGMEFGPEINAYTGFDETVYKLEVPTDDDEVLENAFQVLEDWAHLVSYDDEEVEKERGVIYEEWRLGLGAAGRVRDKMIPALLGGSQYAKRLPIGLEDVFMKAPPQRLRDFYKKWYRPDLMAVIVVGDIEPEKAKNLIDKHFSFSGSSNPVKRKVFYSAEKKENSVLFISDPELTYTITNIVAVTNNKPQISEADYKEFLIQNMVWSMFNDRLGETAKEQNPPFIQAGGGSGELVRTSSIVECVAYSGKDGSLTALKALSAEIERIRRYGFTESELNRTRANFINFIGQVYKERDNIQSSSFASELIDYHLKDIFMPGIEKEYQLYNRFIPKISLNDVNNYAASMIPEDGRLVMITHPDGADVPTEKEIIDVLDSLNSMDIEPYTEEAPDNFLVENPPPKGSITDEENITEVDSVFWHLSNGADVIIKKTDFMDDQILFSAFSRGGLSLESDTNYFSGLYAPTIITQSGLGNFNQLQLKTKLAGKNISLNPYIGNNSEGIYGSFSAEDTETFLQLVYLFFTAPNFDEDQAENIKDRLSNLIENRNSDPATLFNDKVSEIVTNGDFRSEPLDEEKISRLSAKKAGSVYKKRFSGADDFVFVFTGNVDIKELKQACLAWLAPIPSGIEAEIPKDRGVRPPKGIIKETVIKGIDPKSRVNIVFSKSLDKWNEETELAIEISARILENILRETIREDMGGTYNISVNASVQREPYSSVLIFIGFGCDPDRIKELSDKILEVINYVSLGNIENRFIENQKEQYQRSYEVAIKENTYWLNLLAESFAFGDEPRPILPEEFNKLINKETIINTVKRYLDSNNYIEVVLKPEK